LLLDERFRRSWRNTACEALRVAATRHAAGFAMRSVKKAPRLAPVTFSMTAPSTSAASEYSQPAPGKATPLKGETGRPF
jgi:hypothetical protein